MTEREELKEVRVTAAANKTKAAKALEQHRRIMVALDEAGAAIRRARRAARAHAPQAHP